MSSAQPREAFDDVHTVGRDLGDPCPEKTAFDLEYGRLLDALSRRCSSDLGREKALGLPFLTSRDQVTVALDEVREATRLEELGSPLPRAALPILRDALGRARIGSRLNGPELVDIVKALAAARELRKFLRARKEELPMLSLTCDTDPSLDSLAHELERCFESDGSLTDNASPRLAELRSEERTSRARIVKRLDELIGKYKDLLQDGYYTEREGRYVLPVRSDAHERFPGIVHATSAGGGTLFVEPRVMVSIGNRHKVIAGQISQEEQAILGALSLRVSESLPAVEEALEALAHADLRGGSAKLAIDLGLTFPEIPDGEEHLVELHKARHPLLLLDGLDVVPSNVELKSGSALVVSGPNAGGKTVALKTVGLSVLMLRAGLPIPAGSGSRLSLFEEVLTDVGDDQSLTKNLSTFSAHIRNLSHIVDRTGHGTLVLLDELASGTDPREGEALALAVLESLVKRGGAVACTTHYERLKLIALTDRRFLNASVGFDIETMCPTFRLSNGVPGASSALAVARRFGIPAHIVEHAESLLSKETATLSQLVNELDRERSNLEAERSRLKMAEHELEKGRAALEAERDKLARREEGSLGRETEALLVEVKRAREEVRAAKARLRAPKLDPKEVLAAERAVDGAASAVSVGSAVDTHRADPKTKDRPGVALSQLQPGMKVYVPRLRTDAEVLEVLPSGQLRVAAGPLKLLTNAADVRAAESGKSKKSSSSSGESRRVAIQFDSAADPDLPVQTSDNTVDLRGLRSHEAVAIAEQFLDRCVGAGKRVAFLVHGHGTGALRQTLRDNLRTSPYVERSRAGEPREGGDGCTIVWLK